MKNIIFQKKLSDSEINRYCENNNKNLIMVLYIKDTTKLLVVNK